MWMRVLLAVALLLLPITVRAAYIDAEVVSNEMQVNGSRLIVLEVRGNDGESKTLLRFHVPRNPSMAGLRYAVGDKVNELNTLEAVAALPALQPGQIVAPLARPPATPKQVWLGKRQRIKVYLEAQTDGITAVAPDLAALITDVNSSYQSGYLD